MEELLLRSLKNYLEKHPYRTLCFTLAFFLAYGVILIFAGVRLYRRLDREALFTNLRTLIHSPYGPTILSASLVIIGVGFFFFKKKQQLWYGVVETSVALIVCGLTTDLIDRAVLTHSSLSQIVTTAFTAVYLLVRGLSNIDDGRNKESYWLQSWGFVFKEFYEMTKERLGLE